MGTRTGHVAALEAGDTEAVVREITRDIETWQF